MQVGYHALKAKLTGKAFINDLLKSRPITFGKSPSCSFSYKITKAHVIVYSSKALMKFDLIAKALLRILDAGELSFDGGKVIILSFASVLIIIMSNSDDHWAMTIRITSDKHPQESHHTRPHKNFQLRIESRIALTFSIN